MSPVQGKCKTCGEWFDAIEVVCWSCRSKSSDEMLRRVQSMSEDAGQTWDLSENDQTALRYMLQELARLREEVQSLRERLEAEDPGVIRLPKEGDS